jgi:hypothetical protein
MVGLLFIRDLKIIEFGSKKEEVVFVFRAVFKKRSCLYVE